MVRRVASLVALATLTLIGVCLCDTICVTFVDVEYCQVVQGNEWEELGFTISSPLGLRGWIANMQYCDPNPNCLVPGNACPEHSPDGDFVVTFLPGPTGYPPVCASICVWDNDCTDASEYVAFYLTNGDSITFPLLACPGCCDYYHLDVDRAGVSAYISGIRVEEAAVDVGVPNDGIAIDNICFSMIVADKGTDRIGRRADYEDEYMQFLDSGIETEQTFF